MKKAKNLISLMLSIMVVMSCCFSYANGLTNNDVRSETNLLSKDEATIIAESLISSDMPNMNWDKDTRISNIVEMYDQDGNLNSYSFEFNKGQESNGYAVISAYTDSSEVILEYSDDMNPVYNELDLKQDEEVVYLGNLNYYKDDGSEKLRTVENELVDKKDVKNDLLDLRSEENIETNNKFIENLKSNLDDIELTDSKSLINNNIITTSRYIDDPYSHANSTFVGPFVLHSYRNDFENYMPYRVQSGPSCVPNSITNLIVAIGKFHNWNTIVNKSTSQVYNTVVNIKNENNQPYYNNGVSESDIPNYLKKSFGAFSFNIKKPTPIRASFKNIKNQIDSYRPFLICLRKEQNYGINYGHALAGFAYNRLQSKTTGYFASYLKVADGYAGRGRYLNLGSLDKASLYNAKIYCISY